MKDMPAALLVVLSKRDTALFHRVFDRVVDNGRVLRTLFQMIRSGQFGRTSLSSSLQRAFQRWLNEASVGKLLSASIGNDPSLRDVLRLARPTPKDNARRALFGWLTDKAVEKWAPATEADLPAQVQALVAYRQAETGGAAGADPGRPVGPLGPAGRRGQGSARLEGDRPPDGSAGAADEPQHAAASRGVRTDDGHEMVDYVADRIADADEIRRSRQFPYQYLAAYLNAGGRGAAEDQGGAAPGGRDRLRQRAGAAGSGRHRSGRVGLDAVAGHGPPRPRRNEQDALRRRGGPVRGGHPAPQPGQRRHPVRHAGVPGAGRSAGLDPEPGGAAGEVRRRRNGLLAAAARGQHAATATAGSRAACWSATGELGLPAPWARPTARPA